MEPVTARKGDHFAIRFYSPMVTSGGGEVLDAPPLKRRRNKLEVLKLFAIKESGSLLQQLELAGLERPGTFPTLDELILRAGPDKSRARNDARTPAHF